MPPKKTTRKKIEAKPEIEVKPTAAAIAAPKKKKEVKCPTYNPNIGFSIKGCEGGTTFKGICCSPSDDKCALKVSRKQINDFFIDAANFSGKKYFYQKEDLYYWQQVLDKFREFTGNFDATDVMGITQANFFEGRQAIPDARWEQILGADGKKVEWFTICPKNTGLEERKCRITLCTDNDKLWEKYPTYIEMTRE